MADRLGPRMLMFGALGGFAGMACLTQASGLWRYSAGRRDHRTVRRDDGADRSYLAPRVFGQKAVGRAMGLLSGVILVALLSTPPLFGLIFDLTGSYIGIFWAFSGLALLTLLWLPAIRLHPRDYRSAQPVPRNRDQVPALAPASRKTRATMADRSARLAG